MWHSARVDETELRAFAREQLGRQAALARVELGRLAQALEPGEQPRRVAMGVAGRQGVLVLLTDRRLLLGHGWPTRKRHGVDVWPLSELRGVARHMLSVDLDFGDRGTLALALAPEQLAHPMTDALRETLGLPDAAPVRAELEALAQRKLGGRLSTELDADLALLADGLEADEDAQRLAFVADGRTPQLAALTDRRLILVHAALRGHNDRWRAFARDEIAEVTREGDTLWVIVPATAGTATRHPIVFVDTERCDEFQAVLG